MKRLLLAALLAALTLLGACGDEGPSGPTTVQATVRGGVALGAVVLEIQGQGIEAVEGTGGTEAFTAPLDAGGNRYRAVLVASTPGNPTFRVRLASGGAEDLTAVVLSAADGRNDAITALGSVEVRFGE